MSTLSFLISPYSLEKFWTENWTKRSVLISGTTSDKFQHLFTWEHLNQLLNYHQIPYPDLRFAQDGSSLPDASPDRWQELLQQGATLIINSVHSRIPELAKFVAQIRQETGYRSQINLYCSPSSEQGFNCHYDTHEVLILQIDGEKEWFIFPETIAVPVSGMRPADQVPPDVPPYLQCTLRPGDLLYIPRGHWHYAIASGDASRDLGEDETAPALHLTLGIDCQTGLDWMSWLKEELQEDQEWRENLPVIHPDDQTAVVAHLQRLRDRLIARLQTPDAIDRYLHYLGYCDRPPLPFSLPYQLGHRIFNRGFDTRFVASSLHPVQILTPVGKPVQVIIGAKQATLKGLPVDLVRNLFRPDGFSLLDLAQWAPDLDVETVVVPVLTRLVTQGLLQVDS